MATLYLLETRAAKTYQCSGCGATIPRGMMHFRHDPHPMARRHRGERYSHWCRNCILSASPGPEEQVTHRLFVSRDAIRSMNTPDTGQLPLFDPVRVELVGVGRTLSERISSDLSLVHRLTSSSVSHRLCR